MQIHDGTGSGKAVKVNSGNRLYTKSVVTSEDADINANTEKVWSIPFEGLNPAGTDDYVVYIKNTGDKTLVVSDIRASADTAATQLKVNAVSGTASNGTTITPVPRTIQSSAIPTATIESGTDITGLTSEGTIFFIQCAVVNTEYHLNTSSKIRIPKGRAIGLLVETATANITGVISLFEEE
jgi:archaellum component FlaG (FlaF/FlaG flagellin family)